MGYRERLKDVAVPVDARMTEKVLADKATWEALAAMEPEWIEGEGRLTDSVTEFRGWDDGGRAIPKNLEQRVKESWREVARQKEGREVKEEVKRVPTNVHEVVAFAGEKAKRRAKGVLWGDVPEGVDKTRVNSLRRELKNIDLGIENEKSNYRYVERKAKSLFKFALGRKQLAFYEVEMRAGVPVPMEIRTLLGIKAEIRRLIRRKRKYRQELKNLITGVQNESAKGL